jgi:uncharacterized protein YndB with AHSA1/START domain
METNDKSIVLVQCTVESITLEKAWELWNSPAHIVHWNFASPDWHTPRAEVDLSVGGKFLSRFEAKDGSVGFDLIGFYDEIDHLKLIKSHLEDGRKVEVTFSSSNIFDEGLSATTVVITQQFEAELDNTPERQQEGWQCIMDNFKSYAESL